MKNKLNKTQISLQQLMFFWDNEDEFYDKNGALINPSESNLTAAKIMKELGETPYSGEDITDFLRQAVQKKFLDATRGNAASAEWDEWESAYDLEPNEIIGSSFEEMVESYMASHAKEISDEFEKYLAEVKEDITRLKEAVEDDRKIIERVKEVLLEAEELEDWYKSVISMAGEYS